jgi:hypothetical protein
MINIVVTSKPVDGLFYYSYEYCSYLNNLRIDARVIVICHRKFTPNDYIQSILAKYIHCKNIVFDNFNPTNDDVILVMGRSMITLSWQDFKDYSDKQQTTLKKVFSGKVISVYSENHPTKYPLALEFYKPQQIVDLCDTEVYPNGIGDHFEKTIYFDIYKPYKDKIKFEHLFLGTNDKYYATVEKIIDQYPDHGILTYNADYVNIKNNNIFVPVENLMSLFQTYVYTKDTFDPAPRIIQECKYYSKDVIYQRDNSIVDGGSIYWRRNIKKLNIIPILKALEKFK